MYCRSDGVDEQESVRGCCMSKKQSETAMLLAETEMLRKIVKPSPALNMRLTEPASTAGNIGLEEMLQRADASSAIHGVTPLPSSNEQEATEKVIRDSVVQNLGSGVRNDKLDPVLVKPSKWANRNEQSFHGQEWEEFKAELKSAGGNIQPIKVRGVRRANTLPQSYEIVFGHRRHRACLELGLPVFALIEDATDKELFEDMDRENRQRADLSVYEQGEMYRRALEDGMYPSLRQLSDSLSVSLGLASESVAIAKLPPEVLDAFESRLDLQRRWAAPLTKAMEKNPDYVMAVAKAIFEERESGKEVKSSEVFRRLTSSGITAPAAPSAPITRSVKLPGKTTLQVTTQGQKLKLEFDVVDAETAKVIEKAVLAALKG